MSEEQKEQTFKPKVNKKTNERMTRGRLEVTSGNKNIDLYN